MPVNTGWCGTVGTGYGENGYFKLGYGECFVEQYVYYADARSSDVGPLVYDSYRLMMTTPQAAVMEMGPSIAEKPSNSM